MFLLNEYGYWNKNAVKRHGKTIGYNKEGNLFWGVHLGIIENNDNF